MAVFTATLPVQPGGSTGFDPTKPFTYAGLDLSLNGPGVEHRDFRFPSQNVGPDYISDFPAVALYTVTATGYAIFAASIDVTLTLPDSLGLTALDVGRVYIQVRYENPGILKGFGYDTFYTRDFTPLRLVTNPPVPGCRDILATNYNPLATVDNGSCVYSAGGGPGGVGGGVSGGTGPGCMNPLAINYNSLATVDNGSCILPVRGCTIAGSLNYNPSANVNDGSCIPIMRGCTVPGALNYNALANKDDGSCVFFFAYPAGPPPPDLCVWAGDLPPACAWTWSDTFAAPPQAPAQILNSTYYGIGNVALLLGNEPL